MCIRRLLRRCERSGSDLSAARPKRFTVELAQTAGHLVTMGAASRVRSYPVWSASIGRLPTRQGNRRNGCAKFATRSARAFGTSSARAADRDGEDQSTDRRRFVDEALSSGRSRHAAPPRGGEYSGAPPSDLGAKGRSAHSHGCAPQPPQECKAYGFTQKPLTLQWPLQHSRFALHALPSPVQHTPLIQLAMQQSRLLLQKVWGAWQPHLPKELQMWLQQTAPLAHISWSGRQEVAVAVAVLAAVLVAVFVAVISQFISDVGYTLLNPRIRFA